MSNPPQFLTRRLEEYDELVEEREAKLERARAKRDAFREVLEEWEKHASANGAEPEQVRDDAPGEDMSIRDKVVAVLADADEALTRKEIVARAEERGFDLPMNSVRWDTYHGVEDDDVYEKLEPEEGSRAKRYRLKR